MSTLWDNLLKCEDNPAHNGCGKDLTANVMIPFVEHLQHMLVHKPEHVQCALRETARIIGIVYPLIFNSTKGGITLSEETRNAFLEGIAQGVDYLGQIEVKAEIVARNQCTSTPFENKGRESEEFEKINESLRRVFKVR